MSEQEASSRRQQRWDELLRHPRTDLPAIARALVESYLPVAAAFAARFFDNREDANEARQEALAHLMRRVHLVGADAKSIPSRPDAWAFSVLNNKLLDELKKRRRNRAAGGHETMSSIPDKQQLDPSDEAERNEQFERLRQAVPLLSRQQRRVMHLELEMPHKSAAEKAATLDMLTQCWHSTLSEAKKNLRRMLDTE